MFIVVQTGVGVVALSDVVTMTVVVSVTVIPEVLCVAIVIVVIVVGVLVGNISAMLLMIFGPFLCCAAFVVH